MDQSIEKYKKWQPFLLALCSVLGLWAGMNMRQVKQTDSGDNQQNNILADRSQKIKDAFSFVQSKYVDSLDVDRATDLALECFISNLDPYSEYISTQFIRSFSNQIHGKTRGVGIDWIDTETGSIIHEVVRESPAFRAGLRAGDQLMTIGNHDFSAASRNSDSILIEMQSDKSDSIEVKWKDRLHNEIKIVNLPVVELTKTAVQFAMLEDKQTLYIKLNELVKDSYRQLMNVLESHFEKGKCRHLILDLRNNSGGLVHEAAYILNQLIRDKDVMMFKTSGFHIKEKEYRATGKPFFDIDRIVVLINHETASAAELIAAALQDLDRAVVIGVPSFGKATVMEQFSLGDGSAIRLAVSRYYTHSGRSIQKKYESKDGLNYLGDVNEENGTSFYSLKKKRLAAHQGVVPDIQLPFEQRMIKNDYSLRDLTNQMIANQFSEFNKLIPLQVDQIWNDEKINKLIQKSISERPDLANYKDEWIFLQREFRFALADWFYGKQGEQALRLKHDDCLLAALAQISK